MKTLVRVFVIGSMIVFPFTSFAMISTSKAVYDENEDTYYSIQGADCDYPTYPALFNLDTGNQSMSQPNGCWDNVYVGALSNGHWAWVEVDTNGGSNCIGNALDYQSCIADPSYVGEARFCVGGADWCANNPFPM